MELKQVEQEKRREYEIGKYKQSIYDYPVKLLGLQPLDVPLPEYSTSMLPTGWRSEVSMHVNLNVNVFVCVSERLCIEQVRENI